ncbi:MarR family winged helix-turn-helix transcriptional regulator [Roseospira goensis]|uniref:DNA-binding MarR family transcriptional regulator n=1 Tax=Roseospira goensis TaxID=391922 RepID=A0A7W6S283_9PROT|nr:MarR family winged helix-turn-helix transcriptional regulator [Roseospira goensis]MBB4287556.1 DNA-binding MarR family transcriptional regulator [Roseospira goensis]
MQDSGEGMETDGTSWIGAAPGGPGGRPVLRLEAFLPYRLSVLANTISHAVAEAYRERFGLTVPEWRVMATLGEFDGPGAAVTANAVAAHTAMDKVQVSRAISRMIQAGLVARVTDPGDRRRSILTLTEAGRGIYERIVPAALDYERRLVAGLSETERACLARLIDTLTDRATQTAPPREVGAEGP